MLWKLQLGIAIVVLGLSNFLTYKYMDNSCTTEKLKSIEKAYVESTALSKENAEQAKKLVVQKQLLEQKAKQNEQVLRKELSLLDTSCKLSNDGLRILQDAINTANTTGSN